MQPKCTLARTIILTSFRIFGCTICSWQNRIHSFHPWFRQEKFVWFCIHWSDTDHGNHFFCDTTVTWNNPPCSYNQSFTKVDPNQDFSGQQNTFWPVWTLLFSYFFFFFILSWVVDDDIYTYKGFYKRGFINALNDVPFLIYFSYHKQWTQVWIANIYICHPISYVCSSLCLKFYHSMLLL